MKINLKQIVSCIVFKKELYHFITWKDFEKGSLLGKDRKEGFYEYSFPDLEYLGTTFKRRNLYIEDKIVYQNPFLIITLILFCDKDNCS